MAPVLVKNFACEICKKVYKTHEGAYGCEQQEAPQQTHQIGEKFFAKLDGFRTLLVIVDSEIQFDESSQRHEVFFRVKYADSGEEFYRLLSEYEITELKKEACYPI